MKLRKLAALVMAGMMALSMAACGGAVSVDGEKPAAEAGTEAAAATGSGSIGLSVSTLNNPFFVTLSDGAEAKAKELGVELIVVDAGDDSAKQASDIEDLISKNISVLIVNPVDSDAVGPAVQDAVDKGIKVVAVDRVVNGVDVDCSIASDNVAGAKMATEYLVELAGEKAKTAELEGVNGASATIDRGQGFHSVAHNDEMALGAIEAIGDKGIIVAGFDATDDAIEAVKEGKMAATVAQQPDLMGATAVETAQKLINGETVEKSLPVEVSLITKDNVE